METDVQIHTNVAYKGRVKEMIKYKINELDVGTYLELRDSVNWKKLTKEQAKKALEHSLYYICAYEDNRAVAMGRLVGDGAVICYVQDLIVCPQYQHRGVGAHILAQLVEYCRQLRMENTELMLCLMCAKGREEFYKKFDFIPRPTEQLGPGMIQYLHN